jgi:hypothetical protein
MTKILGTTVVLSESTLAKLKDVSPFDIRFLGKVNMVGKEEVLSVYELFNADHSPLREQKQRTFTKYNDAVNSYYAREFTKAAKLFEEIVAETPSDAAAERFLSSARSYIAEPPDADWQGVEVMTVK